MASPTPHGSRPPISSFVFSLTSLLCSLQEHLCKSVASRSSLELIIRRILVSCFIRGHFNRKHCQNMTIFFNCYVTLILTINQTVIYIGQHDIHAKFTFASPLFSFCSFVSLHELTKLSICQSTEKNLSELISIL